MNATSALGILKNHPLFQTLGQEEIQRLDDIAEFEVRPKHSYLYRKGDTSDQIFFLLKGIVKTGTYSEEGREVIKSIYHPVAMFGELGLVGEERRIEFARAMNEEVHFCTISVKNLQRFMRSNHQLCLNILNMVGDRLRKAEQRLEALIFKDARSRIIDFLKDTANQRGRRVGYEFFLKHCLTQQDIANITGTSRQTVTSVLNELKKENLIHFNRKSILIRDMERLA